MVLTPVEPKDTGLESFKICTLCANEYVKEEEKNTTIFTKFHGELLMIISDYIVY